MSWFNRVKQFISNYRTTIAAWPLIVVLVQVGLLYGVDRSILALLALIVGFSGEAFSALLA